MTGVWAPRSSTGDRNQPRQSSYPVREEVRLNQDDGESERQSFKTLKNRPDFRVVALILPKFNVANHHLIKGPVRTDEYIPIETATSSVQPNILICVIDALRADRVGALGGRELTPNIDDFADDAAVFSRAFTTINTTDPAITSIHTGRYPLSHGVLNHGWRVSDEEKQRIQNVPQLPELLLDAGYRTAKFGRPLGRWHRRGFEQYPETGEWRDSKDVDSLTKVEMQLSSRLASIDPRLRSAASWIYERTGQRLRDLLSTDVSKSEIGRTDIADQFSSFVNSGSPFFAFVHMMDPHVPYDIESTVTRRCLEQFEYENTPLSDWAEQYSDDSFSYERLQKGGRIHDTAKPWVDTEYGLGTAVVDAQYDASVRTADRRVGELLSVLEESNTLDQTLVILLSDHGESLTEHGILYDHHGLYDPTIRIPLLVRPPGGVTGNIHSDFIQTTDILPTISSYTTIETPSPVNGESLKPTIERGESTHRDVILAEEAHTQRRRMIRTTEEKLIYSLDGETICRYCGVEHAPPEELYLFDGDMPEQENRASEFQDRVTELRKLAETRAETLSEQSPGRTDTGSVDYEDEEEIYDRLEALGYK